MNHMNKMIVILLAVTLIILWLNSFIQNSQIKEVQSLIINAEHQKACELYKARDADDEYLKSENCI